MECIFCKIISGALPAHKVYEDDYVVAFLDIAPVNPGHILVLPKKHLSSLNDIDDFTLYYLMKVVKKIGNSIKKALNVKGFNIIMNNGAVAGQVVDHFHCHVIPRKETDGLKHWQHGNYKNGDELKLAENIKKELEKNKNKEA